MEFDDEADNRAIRLSEATVVAPGLALYSVNFNETHSDSEEEDRLLNAWISHNIAAYEDEEDDLLVPHHALDLSTIPLPPPVVLPSLSNEGRPYVRFDDPYARYAMHLLKQHGPYCCLRAGADRRIWQDDGVLVYQVNNDQYVIMGQDPVEDVLVDKRRLENPRFNLPQCAIRRDFADPIFDLDDLEGELEQLWKELETPELCEYLELNAARVVTHQPISAIQRNASSPRDFKRLIPSPVVVVVHINGSAARALLDSGSLADFMSSKLIHQLDIPTFELAKQLPVHLAVQGSRAKISLGCKTELKYQSVCEPRHFDIVNLLNYDLILGTPFLFQHKVTIGFNPTTVVIGSGSAVPIQGEHVRVLESRAADLFEDELEHARQVLREYAQPIASTDASDTPLPPLREVNHQIPLKDPSKVYHWRPSKCPEALRPLWSKKRDAYLRSGRWKMSNARNTSPMLLLTKPGTGIRDIPPKLRTVFDLRERNDNTIKVTSPLPDMEGILRRIAKKRFRSSLDGKDAYECIRIEPSHVERAAMTTPDGNMVSLVLQQGDCNAVATYQTLMNHLFGQYIGVFLDVYLDDILIYSDALPEHIEHVKTVIDILQREHLYLNADKLKFLQPELKVLGRIVDDTGIRMDPDKVDSVLNWKVPTSKELLRGFLGSVGYLADDIVGTSHSNGLLMRSDAWFTVIVITTAFRWTTPRVQPPFG
ncbi:hypothetical protein EW026_g8033 [Hermanssonia centrifuga]|uniref:Reverse transcriptase domain-containing protein n=1 Tax=Hermanssonia centrifuga TaxID=98765 RepID=A0A4S4KA73_9APHY|nr:hypothetical protein EW026_g8033 [Hermanssonia centrifuga]